jgi:dihydrofolate reductase
MDDTRAHCPRSISATKSRHSSASPAKSSWPGGGASFAQALSRLGLVDEYRLIHQPVALGDGLPLFKGLAGPLQLELVDAEAYPTGAALHIHRPAALAHST